MKRPERIKNFDEKEIKEEKEKRGKGELWREERKRISSKKRNSQTEIG